jgi:hypothetical protein
MSRIAALLLGLFFLSFGRAGAEAPEACGVSFPRPVNDRANIFSAAQEVDLGDAIAESALLDLRVLAENDPTLQRIAKRLAASAPLPGLRIRTFIVEMPQASALVTPGGRIYVSRALIQLTQNEDELAGIVAHEFGHLFAHQYAIRTSRLMKSTMGVTKVGDRRDIFDQYHRLIERLWTKPRAASPYDLTNPDPIDRAAEFEADRLGLQIQAAAGYDPMAPIRAFDRLAETRGKTGNFFSNFFNFTPDEERLGRMLKNMPTACRPASAHDNGEFLRWRERVLNATKISFSEELDGALSRRTLTPGLAGDLRQLRFGADGRYVLAQDDSGVSVFSVQPLAALFRVAAEDASRAEFTPDGRDIVFVRSGTHLERWSVADHTRLGFTEIPLREASIAENLSPDGRFLLDLDPEWTLRLIDASSGAPILERKPFGASWVDEQLADLAYKYLDWSGFSAPFGEPLEEYLEESASVTPAFPRTISLPALQASMLDFPPDYQSFLQASRQFNATELSLDQNLLEQAAIDFSPDGRFFLAAPERYPGGVLAWDLQKNSTVPVGGLLRKLNGYPFYHFTFMADDRVLVSPKLRAEKSGPEVTASLVAFPSGKLIAEMKLPAGSVASGAESSLVIIRPSPPSLGLTAPGFQPRPPAPASIVDLGTGEKLSSASHGFDAFAGRYIEDNAEGEIELHARADKRLLASVPISGAELGGLRAVAVSAGLSRLLISSESHAAVWNLNTGEALMQFGPVNGGVVDSRGHLLLDVPGTANQKRRMVDLDPESHKVEPGPEVTATLAKQVGPYLVVVRTKEGWAPTFALETETYQNIIFDVLDARTMRTTWSRKFPNQAPWFFAEPSGRYCLLIWPGSSDRVQHDPELRRRLAELDKNTYTPRPLCDFPSVAWRNGPRPTYLLKLAEIVDMATGESVGHVLFDPGDPCMRIQKAFPLGRAIAIEDQHNRVVTYDADSDQPRARVFGHLLAADPVRARIAVGKEAGRVVVYDALTGDQKDEFRFPAPVAFIRFSGDGLTLLAVTVEQEAIRLPVD